jgi:hypothetical protein
MKTKLLTLLTLLVTVCSGAWASTVTFGYAEGNVSISSLVASKGGTASVNSTDGKVTFTITSTNDNTVSQNSSKLKFQNNTSMTVSCTSGYNITNIVITTSESNRGFTASEATFSRDGATSTWSGSSTSITFTNNNSGNNLNVVSVVVTYSVICNITFALPVGATGVVPTAKTGVSGTITLPKNTSMWYADGYSLTKWVDESSNEYAPGSEYTVTADQTLTAKFESNGGTTIADRTAATEIMFDFMQKDGAPSVTWSSGAHFWVAQATVAGKTIDFKTNIAFGEGSPKFDNSAWTDWAQINANTTFTIPSTNGASVEMISFNQDETTTVDGTALTSTGSAGNYTCTAGITSDASTVDVAFNGAGSYYKYIKVTFPAPTYTVDFSLSNVTKTSGEATATGGEDYTATFSASGDYILPSTVTVLAGATDITANCTWTKATGTLTIPGSYVTDNISITINGVTVIGTQLIKAVLTGTSTATVTGTIGGTYSGKTQSVDATYGGCKLGSKGHWTGFTLKEGYTLKTGDIVEVKITKRNGSTSFVFYDSKLQTNTLLTTTVDPEPGTYRFVLPAAANGKTGVFLVRGSDEDPNVGSANQGFNPHVDYIAVTRPDAVVTLNGSGFATFSYGEDFNFLGMAGAKAYKMTLNEETKAIAGTEISAETKIAAGEGILLKGTASTPFAITTTTGAIALENNDLKGSTKSDGTTADKPTYCYVLSGDTFVSYSGASLSANKAYFEASKDLAASARPFTITFDDEETTSIAGVEAKKFVEDNKFYNLNGQQVAQPTKGLYIVNGKKVVIK